MPYNKLGDLQTLTLSDDVQCDNPCCILTLDCIVQIMGNMHCLLPCAHWMRFAYLYI